MNLTADPIAELIFAAVSAEPMPRLVAGRLTEIFGVLLPDLDDVLAMEPAAIVAPVVRPQSAIALMRLACRADDCLGVVTGKHSGSPFKAPRPSHSASRATRLTVAPTFHRLAALRTPFHLHTVSVTQVSSR